METFYDVKNITLQRAFLLLGVHVGLRTDVGAKIIANTATSLIMNNTLQVHLFLPVFDFVVECSGRESVLFPKSIALIYVQGIWIAISQNYY